MGEIRIVSPGKTRGCPCPMCKKEKSVTRDHCLASLGKPLDADQ